MAHYSAPAIAGPWPTIKNPPRRGRHQVITDAETDKLLSMSIINTNAGEAIAEAVLAASPPLCGQSFIGAGKAPDKVVGWVPYPSGLKGVVGVW